MIKMDKERRERIQSRDVELITNYSSKSPLAEAYRTLRTNIEFLSPDDPLETMVITSSVPQEGKSITIANLAVSMAENGQQVIVIDADMRKPMQHRIFEITNFGGLSDLLTGELNFAEGLQKTNIEGISLISGGNVPPNPAELLGSQKMEEVIKQAENKADIVLIDSPPVIAVTDSRLLANKVDGVMLVVAAQETDEEALAKSQQMLEKVQANVIGTVLTKYPAEESNSYYSGYYNYYG
ncbi:capsular exopolysaccharide family [Acetohalobium arabaticum DSM 5501]|uniref:non-specific protein-tyrosine kinase n=2 Tax=Acetohalobium TaxID=28186 RepID=D9QTC6_ACEAZ|nr:capsular exopolysaccharide family [Acetohalobium arabaticum DSM 5501]